MTPYRRLSPDPQAVGLAHDGGPACIVIQRSHPDDWTALERELAEIGLVPFILNGSYVFGASQEDLTRIFDGAQALVDGPAEARLAFRASAVEALAGAISVDGFTDPALVAHALLLFADAMTHALASPQARQIAAAVEVARLSPETSRIGFCATSNY